jgi:tRNA dimethylallyltransferase
MPNGMSIDAVLIAGPTASGKSHAALMLAERLGGAVINCDSMQVYAELRLLSARPTAAEEARAPHFLYGHVPVRERYSAGRYQDDAAHALAEAYAANRLPIFVGGTGLYFGALLDGLSPIPPVPNEIRTRIRARFEEEGTEAVYAALAERDPETASRLKLSDTQRILRALDVLEATGRPLSAWQKSMGKPVLGGYRLARYIIAPPRAALYERIGSRFAAMIKAGALEEARALMGLDPALPAAKALGLPQLQRHLAGRLTLEAAIAEAGRETRNYAKRQLTWFRSRMRDWRWIQDSDARSAILVDLSLWER